MVDLLCLTDEGEYINIELQAQRQERFDRRILAYLANIYLTQVGQGEEFIQHRRTISINVLGFNLTDQQSRRGSYISRYNLRDEVDHDAILSDDLDIYVVQTRKFQSCMQGKTFRDMSRVERFISLFCKKYTLTELQEMGQIDQNPQKIAEAFKVFQNTPEEYLAYVQEELDRISYDSEIKLAESRGKSEGEVIGEDRGRRETNLETARRMKAKKYDFAEISEITGLSTAEILAL